MQIYYLAMKTRLGKTVATGANVDDLMKNMAEKIDINETRLMGFVDAMVKIESMSPDISGTAPEHVAVYSAGWNAAVRACVATLYEKMDK